MSVHLSTPLSKLTRVGEITATRLKLLGLSNVLDLLLHYPFRFEDYTNTLILNALTPLAQGTARGTIASIAVKKTARKKMSLTEAFLENETGSIKLVWFNQPFIARTLHEGDMVSVSGTAEHAYGAWAIKNPAYEKCAPNQDTMHTGAFIPIYPATLGLTQKQIRFLMHQALVARDELLDVVPEPIAERAQLLPLSDAVYAIHAPKSRALYERARRRLAFGELFFVHLLTEQGRNKLSRLAAPAIPFNETRTKEMVLELPFTLTNGQKKAAWRILQDIARPAPMNRLLQGDVGSGKTVVVALAALNAAESNYQTAIMAPTEILAYQHYETIAPLFPRHAIALLTRSYARLSTETNITRDTIKERIANGNIHIVIGTHAMIQKDVAFCALGLVVVDEQHRFGVDARHALTRKSARTDVPHFLSMTATPIPRTLALTIYGDLDITTIREMPKNRKPIITTLIGKTSQTHMYDAIRIQLAQGRQLFVVCPLIEESDAVGASSVTAECKKMKNIFPEFSVGMVHGKLSAHEKSSTMKQFNENKIHILVSTSVIEVGVDVPNASCMLIEGADRFGLSQLHQFRGRVGRSGHQSYCFLRTQNESPETLRRLGLFTACNDGFAVAELDLSLRGQGERYGTAQSGENEELKIATLADADLIAETKEYAHELIQQDSELTAYPSLRQLVLERGRELHFE